MTTNFLAFQVMHIGDLVETLPALGLIRRHRPDAKIGAVVRPGSAPLAEAHPWIDEVFAYQYESGKLGTGLQVIRNLRRAEYAVSFIFDAKRRSALTSLLSGQKLRLRGDATWPHWKDFKRFLCTRQLRLPWRFCSG